MKNNIILTILVISFFSCKAQSPILPVYGGAEAYGSIPNSYHKDLNNDYNRFEGTWFYSSGNTSLTIVLEKKEMQNIDDGYVSFYSDLLVGEYKYIQNGQLIINTLNNLSLNFDNPYKYNITGGAISKPIPGVENSCFDCGPDEIKVILSFSDPEREILGSAPQMVFHHFLENGIEKLKLVFGGGGNISQGLDENGLQYTSYNIPYGEYILIKQ